MRFTRQHLNDTFKVFQTICLCLKNYFMIVELFKIFIGHLWILSFGKKNNFDESFLSFYTAIISPTLPNVIRC